MIVLDTTILVYAVGGDHPLADPCRRIVEAVGGARIRASTTSEAVQEFVHVRARRRSRRDAATLGRAFAELLAPLLIVDDAAVADGLRLFERTRKLGAFDCALAAAAISNEAEAIVSADASFAEIGAVAWWRPDGREIARLLGAAQDEK